MAWQRQAIWWALFFLFFLGFIYLFSEILLPFVAGMILAYILDPIADKLEDMGLSRMAATITILLVSLLFFVLALLVVVPLLGKQLGEFIEQIPSYIKALQAFLVSDTVMRVTQFLPVESGDLQGYVGSFVDDGARWLSSLLGSLLSGGQALLGIISLFVITPVVAFYLLFDWDNMVARINSWLPREHASTIRKLMAEMSDMIAGFLRAQGLVCVILGIFYAVALSLTGLNFGMLIGLGIGFISFVPFIGAILGLLVAIGVALAQFLPEQNYLMIGIVAGVFAIGQFFEGNILQPRILGNHVQLHPVWLMFALFAFASLYGFVGMLIAVPTAACIGVLVRFAMRRYLASELYLGPNSNSDGK